MPLNPEDQRHLTAAQGYAELQMFLDANEELEKIDADVRHVPEVLAVRVEIYTGLKKWELLRTVAKKLADHDPDEPQWPISLAYATRRAESIEAAKLILLEAVERHPKEPMIHYNLACYDSVMGEVEVAKARLRHAFQLEPRCRLMALEDEDLRAVWDSLGD
jgi:hypothetical protein